MHICIGADCGTRCRRILHCVCKTKDIDEHSQVHNRRICKDGPVFYAEEVEL